MKPNQQQIDNEVAKGDYTGNLPFFKWLIYIDNNWWRMLAGIILIGIGVFLLTPMGMEQSLVSYNTQMWIAIGGMAAGVFICIWTIRMYFRLKKGISD